MHAGHANNLRANVIARQQLQLPPSHRAASVETMPVSHDPFHHNRADCTQGRQRALARPAAMPARVLRAVPQAQGGRRLRAARADSMRCRCAVAASACAGSSSMRQSARIPRMCDSVGARARETFARAARRCRGGGGRASRLAAVPWGVREAACRCGGYLRFATFASRLKGRVDGEIAVPDA